MSEVTRILDRIDQGDPHAAERLLPLVYEELHKLAAARMANEPPGQTLQATALVHEAWLRLSGSTKVEWNGRAHFFGAAAEAMRRILVDRARKKARPRHGGGLQIAIQWQNQTLGPAPATDAVVIDGKEVRGGKLMLVNALAQPSQRLLGVESVARKTNEIPTARTLIQRLELQGKLVQLDGMHTQHQTVHQILYEKGADYSLILRDNQRTLLKTAQTLLPADTPPCTGEKLPTRETPGVPGDRDPHD